MGSLDKIKASQMPAVDPEDSGSASRVTGAEGDVGRVQVRKTFPHVLLQPEHVHLDPSWILTLPQMILIRREISVANIKA